MDTAFINSFRTYKTKGNFVLDLNPISKLNIMLFIPIFAGLLGSWAPRLVAVCLLFVIAAAAGSLKSFASLYLKVGGLLFTILFIMRVLFYPGDNVRLSLGRIAVTTEGIQKGVTFGLMVVSLCGAVILFYKLTSPKDLMHAIEKLGAPHATSYIILASFQTIIDLGNATRSIMESQSARGIETKGSLKTRFKAFVPILGPLFLGAMTATEEKAIAMETRAFSAPGDVTYLYELRPAPLAEKVFVILLDICLVALIVWRIFL